MARMSKRKMELREEIDKVLRQMCFGRAYREYCEGVISQIINTAVVYDRCIQDTIVVDEDMVVTALMEIVFRDYEYEEFKVEENNMSLINELKEKSTKMEITKNEIVAEIKNYFDKYLNSDRLENYLKHKIGNTEIKARKVFMQVEFWEYHSGCSTTHFHCGGYEWYNPKNRDGWESHTYNGIELKTINNEIGNYLSSRLINRMNELGFYLVSKENKNNRFGYYDAHFYFGW